MGRREQAFRDRVRERVFGYVSPLYIEGPIAMPSGVWPGRLCINAPCVSGEWHEQEGFFE